MKQEDMVRALAELEGWEFRKSSSPYQCDGWWSPDNRGPFDDRGMAFDSGLHNASKSYDCIIPLIQRLHGYDGILAYTEIFEELSKICAPCECGQHWAIWMMRFSPAQLCEALLKATGKWQE